MSKDQVMKFYNAAAPSPRRVRIFLAEKNLELPRDDLDLQQGATRTPEFLAKNSLGGTPVLELDDGTILTESVAICRYIESMHPAPPLMGADELNAAKVEMWNRRMEIEIFATLANIAQHTFDFFADKLEQVPAFAEAQKRMAVKKWQWLEGELADGRPFIAGDRFSIADITGMAALMVGDFVGVEIPTSLGHVNNWNDSVRSRASWDA
ncbi:MAG: glutathione S-transferase family protein [Aestuariivirgaceae bacterium]